MNTSDQVKLAKIKKDVNFPGFTLSEGQIVAVTHYVWAFSTQEDIEIVCIIGKSLGHLANMKRAGCHIARSDIEFLSH